MACARCASVKDALTSFINQTGIVEKTVQAVYENGALHPLEPLPLGKQRQVTVTISDKAFISPDHPLLVSSEEWSDAAQDDIGLDEVRRALSTIRGSLSEAVLEERRER